MIGVCTWPNCYIERDIKSISSVSYSGETYTMDYCPRHFQAVLDLREWLRGYAEQFNERKAA